MLKAISIGLLLASSTVSAQSQEPPAQTSQQQPAPDKRGTEDSPIVVKVIPTEPSKDQLARENAKDEQQIAIENRNADLTGSLALYTELLFVATAFLGLCSFGLVVVGFRQVRDAKDSIVATKQVAVAAELSARAAIGIELPVFLVDGPEFQSVHPNCALKFLNKGRSHAVVYERCLTFVVDKALPEKPRYPVASVNSESKYIDVGEMLVLDTALSVTNEQWDQALRGEAVIWIFGYFEYQDFLHVEHVERFCYGSRPFGPTKIGKFYDHPRSVPGTPRAVDWVAQSHPAYTYSGYREAENKEA